MSQALKSFMLAGKELGCAEPRNSERPVYWIGPRYGHYATHSGYERISEFIGRQIWSPMAKRWLSGNVGWRIDSAVTRFTSRPLYSLSNLLTEVSVFIHMLFHRRGFYHVYYGSTDVWLLGFLRRVTGNLLAATFHEHVPALEWFRVEQVAKRLDAIFLVSMTQRVAFKNVPPDIPVFVVPHGVDTTFFRPADRLSADPVCITVGLHLRDFETYSGAIEQVLSVRPDARFIAVGTRRDDKDSSKLWHDKVEFYDNISDEQLLELYHASRVACFSLSDLTCSNAILEAMACGLPLVLTNVGGALEYVTREAAVLCRPGDANEFAQGIVALLEHRPEIAKMGAASRQRALRFDFTTVAEEMRRAYLLAVSDRRQSGIS